MLLATESLELPKPASFGLVLWKVRKVLMEQREKEEQSRAGISFLFFLSFVAFFFSEVTVWCQDILHNGEIHELPTAGHSSS